MKRKTIVLLVFAIIFLVFLTADIFFGSVSLPFNEIWKALWGGRSAIDVPSYVSQILWTFRLPKACTALLCGAALSVCGVQMQTLFRNPLADPYVLGISSGAGLGVALFVMGESLFGHLLHAGGLLPQWFSDMGVAAGALIGAIVVTLLVMGAAQRLHSNMSVLVLGIMIGSAGSALIGLLQYFSNAQALKVYVLWTMGSFTNVTGNRLLLMAILCVIGLLLAFYNIKDLNVLLMGSSYARSLGLNPGRIRNRIFLSTTLLAGSVTAFCGPIGFIGIAVPHIVRMSTGNANHRTLLPLSALVGAALMLLADVVSQLPGTQSVLPINTVAALLGVPIIIYVLLKNKNMQL